MSSFQALHTLLYGFYFMHDCHNDLILMEDDALVYYSLYPNLQTQAHSIRKIQWLANSQVLNLSLNPTENSWKLVKDGIQNEAMPYNKG